MIYTSIHIKRLRKPVTILAACLLTACAVHAQDRDKYDSIAAKYKNENAVYTDIKERLVIKEEDGKLVASSSITKEKLFISDLSLSNNTIDYFFYSGMHDLQGLDAVAFVPSKNGYKRVPCYDFANVSPKDFIFYDDSRAIEVLYSGLLKNSITETKYALEHTDVHMLEPFDFQDDIRTVKTTYEVVAPAYVNISFVLKGENTDWIKQTKEEKNGIVTYRFTANDVPAFKSYDNVPSQRYYMPHVIPFITSYKFPDAKEPVEMLSKADELYKYLYKYVRNLNMKEDTFINNTVAEITKNDVTQREKAMHIYQWVQQNIHYIAFEFGLEGFTPREASLVYKRKYGDCKDMSGIIVAMCHRAGLDAYYTWIGTRHLPYVIDETPLSMVNNHMIAVVKLGDQWVFMDGTDPTLPFGSNREDIEGKEAMIAIDAKNYKVVTIPVEAADKNITVDSTSMSISDAKVTGSVNIAYKGYPAWDIAFSMLNIKSEDREKLVRGLTERGTNRYEQKNFDIALNDKGNRDVYINAGFTIDDYVQKVGREYYVNMNLNRSFEDNRINDPERKVPYFYDYKHRTKEVVVLAIPQGYKVTHLPKDTQGNAGGLWSYNISYKADKNQVTLTKEYELNTMSVGPAKFAEHNKTIDDLKRSYKESVVLTAK